MGVGDEALRGQMMESMPIVEQINVEFRDPVSFLNPLSLFTLAVCLTGKVDVCLCVYCRVSLTL